ncbi:MAG: hypothetical protein K6A92_11080 [Lachnospiraceae bacterium]|nr:hypothetical protein [Lachnospiraceae bacterium]
METKIAYPEEKLDGKLQLILYLRQLYKALLGGVLCALLLGGIYLLSVTVFAPAKQYEATAQYYVEYALQEDGMPYTYINDATWNSLVGTDLFMEDLTKRLPGYSREELTASIKAQLLSDVRYLVITYTSDAPEKTMEIFSAFGETLQTYVANQREIDAITIIDTPREATLVLHENRLLRVALFGFLAGTALCCILLYIFVAADDRIYLPITLEKRYGIPALWTGSRAEIPALANALLPSEGELLLIAAEGKKELLQEGEKVLHEAFSGGQIPGADDGITSEKAEKQIKIGSSTYDELLKGDLQATENLTAVLLVDMGSDAGTCLESMLDTCNKLGMPVKAALCLHENKQILSLYYGKGSC